MEPVVVRINPNIYILDILLLFHELWQKKSFLFFLLLILLFSQDVLLVPLVVVVVLAGLTSILQHLS